MHSRCSEMTSILSSLHFSLSCCFWRHSIGSLKIESIMWDNFSFINCLFFHYEQVFLIILMFQMERSPVIGWLFHVRILSLLTLLAHADLYFIHHAYSFTTSKGPSVQVVFGFEYSILIFMIANILIKVRDLKFVCNKLYSVPKIGAIWKEITLKAIEINA